MSNCLSLSPAVSVMEVQVELPVESAEGRCCALSSDDSLCEEPEEEETSSRSRPWIRHISSSSSSSSTFCTDRRSSGYSSIQSVPSPSVSSSLVSPQNLSGFRLLLPPASRTRRQVKRKNTAAHSGGEEAERDEDGANLAFLSLWSTGSCCPLTHHFLAARQEHFRSRVVFYLGGTRAWVRVHSWAVFK